MSDSLPMSMELEDTLPFGLSLKPNAKLPRDTDEFRKILDGLPAAIYATDAKGRIIYFNEAAADLWGCRPELGKSQWCGSWKLFWPDGRPLSHDECPMALSIKEKRPIRGMEAIAERPDGTRVPFIPYPTPLYDPSGRLIGAVNMLVETADRNRAAEYAERLASIVESCDDAIFSKDLNGIISSWNHGAEKLFGYSADEVIGKSITLLIPYGRLAEENAILARLRRGERVDHYETIRRHKNGSDVEIALTVSPLKDADGRIIGASKIARDITERKRAQEQKNMLLFEMKHRVKNTLAIVQALVNQTLRSASAEERAAFVARLHSLSAAHDLLTLEQWDRASLRHIAGAALDPFQATHRERFLIDGPDVLLESNKSLGLAMALHEFAVNAVKYGALSIPGGRVSLTWEAVEGATPARVRLHWKERGGPVVNPPQHKGFGSRLIEHTLGGGSRVAFDPHGVECVWEMTL